MGRPANMPDVLWAKVDKRGADECWPWLGFKTEKLGYGRTWIGNKGYYAHRVIYDLVNPGKITLSAPKSVLAPGFIRHTCDNPPCCNPNHMVLGTNRDNVDDKVLRGRQARFKSTESPNSKFTAEEVFWIRIQKNMEQLKMLWHFCMMLVRLA